MIRVDLTSDQVKLLQQVLESSLRELRDEIRHTDSRDFRELLKSQESSLQELTHSLNASSVPAAA